MVAFNFKKEFVPKILAGEKFSTIRSKQRCNVGDNMQLYTGQRTKACQKIGETVCTGIAMVEFLEPPDDFWIAFPLSDNVFEDGVQLYQMEGFANDEDMKGFFRTQYGLPYIGYLHKFKPLTAPG
jgi:hypothetical protein